MGFIISWWYDYPNIGEYQAVSFATKQQQVKVGDFLLNERL